MEKIEKDCSVVEILLNVAIVGLSFLAGFLSGRATALENYNLYTDTIVSEFNIPKPENWARTYEILDFRVVDGDTVEAEIDLGFDNIRALRGIRIMEVDTPELRSSDPEEKAAAKKAKNFVENELTKSEKLLLYSNGQSGKFGRILGDIGYVKDGQTNILSEVLINKGLGNEY